MFDYVCCVYNIKKHTTSNQDISMINKKIKDFRLKTKFTPFSIMPSTNPQMQAVLEQSVAIMPTYSITETPLLKVRENYALERLFWNTGGPNISTIIETEVEGPHGEIIDLGVIDYWQNEVDGLKGDQDALNEFYRQFPRTTEHAFRDETKNSIFNLVKIYEPSCECKK